MRTNKKIIVLMICAFCLCFAATSFAMVPEESIVGEIVSSNAGYAIVTDGGWYLVEGYDVSGLLGKTVKATGSVSEQGGVKTITVTALEEI
jgi:hypothetical protein